MLIDTNYVCDELVTYLGNKRRIVSFINDTILELKDILGKDRIISFDGFSGSGCVSRLLKYHSSVLYTNDIEYYANIVNSCYLSNKEMLDKEEIEKHISIIERLPLIEDGFIYNNYAPKDDTNIQLNERVFYTTRNAKFIDTAKHYIFNYVSEQQQKFLLAPLLVKASIHTNTSGVFKGFYKNKEGIGCFGGEGRNALQRITGDIQLYIPTLITQPCSITIFNDDTISLLDKIPECDIVYYDPPYNQHPYGSNYFMLNLIAKKEEQEIQNGVSGITKNWYKSDFNIKKKVGFAMESLIKNTKSKYILVSYNNEGFLSEDELFSIFKKYGDVSLKKHDYTTFRGCRNLSERSNSVKELLWVIKTS